MRETRKAMMAKRGRSIAPPEVMELPPLPPPAESTLTQTRHIKCPCCGLQSRVYPDPFQDLRRGEPLPSISEGPYMPEARMVTWGGSKPKDMPGQRVQAKVKWDPPEPCSPEELEMLLQKLNGAISMISSISQEIGEGEEAPEQKLERKAVKLKRKAVKLKRKAVSEASKLTEEKLSDLKAILDEDHKAKSIKKLENEMNKLSLDEEVVEGYDEVSQAIDDYREADREDKESAWEELVDAVEAMQIHEGGE